jgi:hypothetical protein
LREIIIVVAIIILASNVLLLGSILMSKWFRRWRTRRIRKGLINYLGLSDWFANLTPNEQGLFKQYYAQVTKTSEWVDSLTEGKIYSTSEKPAQLLWMVGVTAILNSSFPFAEKLLVKAQAMCNSPWERQQVNIAFAFLYFKQKDLVAGARENCIRYCEAAIRNIEKFGTPENMPTLPFDNLISLYAEARDFELARKVAQKAIELAGQGNSKTKTLYEKKLEELKHKV